MHTVRLQPSNPEEWQVIFVVPTGLEVIACYSDKDTAMQYCSYLNGGLPPWGYTMNVVNHY